MKKLILTILSITLYTASLTAGEGANTKFSEANALYQKGEYEQAISIYESITKLGLSSAELYFNLGNAYYKTDHLAPAILNYERALKLAPDDEDIIFNLRLANTRVVDKITPVPQIFYHRWWNALSNSASSSAWSIVSIILFIITLILFTLFIIHSDPSFKKLYFTIGITSALFSGTTYLLASSSYKIQQNNNSAIVFSPSAYIKSSPDEHSTDLFILHEGTKVEVQDSLSQWRKIKLINGNVGWLASSKIVSI